MGKQRVLSMQDRKLLADCWEEGEGAAEIAERLGCCAATVYVELRRGATGELDGNKRPAYDPELGLEVYQRNLRKRGRRRGGVTE